MKKTTFLIALVLFLNIVLHIPYIQNAGAVGKDIDVFDDFQGYSQGALSGQSSVWSVTAKTDTGGRVDIVKDGSSQVVRTSVECISTTQSATDSYIQSSSCDMSDKVLFSFKIKIDDTSKGSLNVILRDNNSDAGLGSVTLMSIGSGSVKYLNGFTNSPVTESFSDNSWVTFRIVADIHNGVITAYKDGIQKALVSNIRNFSSKIANYNFASAAIRYQLYVSKAVVGNKINMYMDDVSIQSDKSVDTRFGVTANKLYRDYGGKRYEIQGLYKGDLTATVNIENLNNIRESVMLFAAVYDSNGKLLQVAKGSSIAIDAGQKIAESISITINQLNQGDTLKFMIWDGIDNMMPIARYVSYEQSQYTRPLGVEILADMAQKNPSNAHPRIILTPDRLTYLKQACKTDSVLKAWYAKIKASADKILTQGLAVYDDTDELRLQAAGTVEDRIFTLAFVYCIEGNDTYAERAYAELANCATVWPDWNPKHFLDTSALCVAYGIAYDWMYDYFNKPANQVKSTLVKNALKTRGLNEAKLSYEGKGVSDWWATTDNNWSMVCNGGVAVGALAIGDEPEYADISGSVLQSGLLAIEKCLPHFAPDGAWYEGPGYWNYTVEYLSMYFSALKTATGSDYGYMNTEGISTTGYFPIGITGLSNTFNLHDAGEGKINSSELFYLGNTFNNKEFASYRYYQLQSLGFAPTVKDIIWYNPDMIGNISSLATDYKFRDTEVLTFRNSFYQANSVFAGVHGGLNGINHGQIDAGNFIYETDAVRWAIDLGGDNYNLYSYFNNANTAKSRWSYYRNRGEGHNTVILNPGALADQPLNSSATISLFVSDADKGIGVIDMQPIYGEYTNAAKRGIWLDKQSGGLIVQDDMSFKTSGNKLYWFMHTKASVAISNDKKSAILTQSGKKLWIGILDDIHTFTLESATPLATSPNPNLWAENIAKPSDSSNTPTQNANVGISKLQIYDAGAGGDYRICVYMIPLKASETQPSSIPQMTALSGWGN